jgi:hypothetical protein
MLQRACRVTVLCGAALLSGCGSGAYELASVRGKVTTCEGKPAVGGTVIFYPIDDPQATGRPAGSPGREARGTVGEDGTFTLTSVGIEPVEGAITGRHRVEFEMPPTQRPALTAADKANLTPEEIKRWEEEYARRPVYEPLPCTAAITPSEVTVTPGENMLEFTLPPK